MTIRIDDAPNIKSLKIDINFEDGEASTITSITENDVDGINNIMTRVNKGIDEVPLDLGENFEVDQEVVTKPEIPEVVREVKVSSEMVDASY